jgi:hypothetical protein
MSTWAVVSWLYVLFMHFEILYTNMCKIYWELSTNEYLSSGLLTYVSLGPAPHKGQGLSHGEEILNFCLKLVSFTLAEDNFDEFFVGWRFMN